MIKITSLNKIYKSKKRKRCHALSDINLTLPDTGLVFVLGKSGSGKSTLLNLIGGLDNVTSGSIEVDGNDLAKFREKDFCNYRNTHVGFIFQDYHLIDELTVYENIVLSLDLRRIEDKDKVKAALEKVDLAGYEDRYPTELSGGEQQRVAIARAIVKKPRIILADEPTGNLDTNTATAVIQLLKALSKECLILIVSHNISDANAYADRIIELRKGTVISDKTRNPEFPDEVILTGEALLYPDGSSLSDGDIDLINGNKQVNLVKRKDKFLPTKEENRECRKVQIENKSLKFAKKMGLSGKFLKNKALAISLSSFMVAVIMVIMALAQTIIAFDGGEIVAEEMVSNNQNALFLNKVLDSKAQLQLDANYLGSVEKGDIQAFYDASYQGKIYKGVTYTIPIASHSILSGRKESVLRNNLFISQTLATLIVDENFLERKFGGLRYCAKRNEFHPDGVIITDYIADAILSTRTNYLGKDYEHLVRYGYVHQNWKNDIFIINGIIETGYKETYKGLIDKISEAKGDLTVNDLYEDTDFRTFLNDVYDRLGYSYTLDPDFMQNYLESESWAYPSYFKLVFNGTADLSSSYTYIQKTPDNGSEIFEPDKNWRYTEMPPVIPDGAKYIRVSYYSYYTKHMAKEKYGLSQDYPILVFDRGEPIGKEMFEKNSNSILAVNGDLGNYFVGNVSDYIEIPENATITQFLTVTVAGKAFCAFYDAEKNFLSSEMANNIVNEEESLMLLPASAYEKLFPEIAEKLGQDWKEKVVPQKMTVAHYTYGDVENKHPLFEKEVTVGLTDSSTIYVSDDLFSLFYKDSIFEHALYLDGTNGIEAVLDCSDKLNYEHQSIAVEGIHTMTKAVDVFVPIFELIAVILCVGVIFILVNFSTKMINSKMHEIGILKALGTKNNSIGVVFGLQVVLIALLTCILSTVGYYFFIDIANDVLIESLKRLAPSSIVLELDFLTFKPTVALVNCALVFALSLVSLVIPMIKIKSIKPVKIIKAKE